MSNQKRILCVEDDAEDCELLSRYLHADDYTVSFVSTATEALSRARSERFDLFICDVALPDWSGLDLVRAIREFDSATPIIFSSARAHPDEIEAGLAAGANAYFTKPSNYDQIAETVRRLTT